MKKLLRFLVVLLVCGVILSPLTVFAGSYKIGDSDMTVNIDEKIWYVFTRDNLEGNPELEELGLDYAEMVDYMYSDDVYINAVLYFLRGGYLDLYIMKWSQEFEKDFIDYSDSELLELGQDIHWEIAAEDNIFVYENPNDRSKYIVIECEDEEETFLQYVTNADSTTYMFQFWTDGSFTEEKYEAVERIMDGVRIDVAEAVQEESGLPGWLVLFFDLKWVWLAVAAVTAVIMIIDSRSKGKSDVPNECADAVDEAGSVDGETEIPEKPAGAVDATASTADEPVKSEEETENTLS